MKKLFLLSVVLYSILLISCKKYLDKKPDIKLAIPTSLDEFQQLLSDPSITENSVPGVMELGTDNYFHLTTNTYQSSPEIAKNSYIWAPDIWEGATVQDWNLPYNIIYRTNVVLEGLEDFVANNNYDHEKWKLITGQALFIRAITHYFLQETFGQPYRPGTSSSDLGIPLRLEADLSRISTRSTVEQTFSRILSDLSAAATYLPSNTETKNKPSKAAVFAMLARVYLTLQNYDKAFLYADSSLQLNGILTDYNSISTSTLSGTNPFSGFQAPNDKLFEILYPSFQFSYSVFNKTTVIADTALFKLYDVNDLRRTAFFRFTSSTNTYSFKGNYSGLTSTLFAGPAVDEMYLTRAECYARLGNKNQALSDLDTLIKKRWKNNGTWMPATATDAEEALRKILSERRKELVVRGIRWSDLRRLNQDPRFAISITRIVDGQTYTLPPNDKKYTYPIPENEIQLSGMPQNPR